MQKWAEGSSTLSSLLHTITAFLLSISLIFSPFASTFITPLGTAHAADAAEANGAADDSVPAEPDDPELRREREIGRKAVKQIEEQMELIADPARIAHLTMIAEKLRYHLERDIPYEVRIIRSDLPNAFCLPGGFIFFTSRMLELLSSDSEIAAVMAHEMVHIDRSHSIKMAAKANRVTLAAIAAILVSGGAMAPIVLAQVAQVAMTSAYSIEFEKEADSVGLDVLIAANYSPTGMVTLMEKFMHEEMKRAPREYGIYMGHPESVDRVQSMSEKLRSLRISLERKTPLQLLRTSIKEDGGKIHLLIDGIEVWGGEQTAHTLEMLEQAQVLLNRDFQMELAPYDLQLEGDGKNQSLLRLKNNVLAKTPLPEGMPDLAAFRGNLLAALARAQAKHPIAKYFR